MALNLQPLRGNLQLALHRLLASARTLPRAKDWVHVAAALVATSAISLPLGLLSGFLKPSWPPANPGVVLTGCVVAFIQPALLEEALFRSALLPHPAVDPPAAFARATFARAAAAPLLTFVTYHLANPRAESRRVFWDWRFLSLAGVLGATCSAVHWATGGSLVATAVTHWLPVCLWLFYLGGYEALGAVQE